MFAFQVDGMSCSHCASAISEAVRSVDSSARVAVDLATLRVEIESTRADAGAFGKAIVESGYTAVLIEGMPSRMPRVPDVGCGHDQSTRDG